MRTNLHILLICLGLSFGFTSTAQAEVNKKDRVKTAIIYNLARFIEWRQDSITDEVSKFSICVATEGPMEEALLELEGKTIAGTPITVSSKTTSDASLGDCHILYVPAKVKTDYDLVELANQGVLTIGDQANFLSAGGGIAIVTKNNKLGFSINQTAMLQANIKPSSKILRLATEVR